MQQNAEVAKDIPHVSGALNAARSIDRGFRPSAEVIERTQRVRQVMEAVMKQGTHYGTIPGTPKPTLFQPGCDVLAVTFRIAPKVALVEDLSTTDTVRYRITVSGLHQVTGELLAEGIGECSSDEEKYRWRRPVCDEEFADTPADRRREKWAKGQGKPYKQKQVRTSPPDVANTVLKMATKRAKVAMILNATAASDVFAQDLEDLTDELREHLADEGEGRQAPPVVPMPQANGRQAPASAPVTSQPEPPHPAEAAPAPASIHAQAGPLGQPPVPTTPNTAFRRDAVRITKVEPATTSTGKSYGLVTLSTGETFGCWHTNTLLPMMEGWRDAKTLVDLDCQTAKDTQYRPRIEKAEAVR